MTIPVLVIGDTFEHPGTFYAGDPRSAYDITGATVKVSIVSPDHAIKYCDDVTQSINPDYNGANGRQLVRIPSDISAQIGSFIQSQGAGKIELQVDDGNSKYTWFSEVSIVRGQVA